MPPKVSNSGWPFSMTMDFTWAQSRYPSGYGTFAVSAALVDAAVHASASSAAQVGIVVLMITSSWTPLECAERDGRVNPALFGNQVPRGSHALRDPARRLRRPHRRGHRRLQVVAGRPRLHPL